MRAKVQKWGNSLALRLPKALARQAHLDVDGEVQIQLVDGRLVITPLLRKLSLQELLDKVTPDNLHEEVDFGPGVGPEVW